MVQSCVRKHFNWAPNSKCWGDWFNTWSKPRLLQTLVRTNFSEWLTHTFLYVQHPCPGPCLQKISSKSCMALRRRRSAQSVAVWRRSGRAVRSGNVMKGERYEITGNAKHCYTDVVNLPPRCETRWQQRRSVSPSLGRKFPAIPLLFNKTRNGVSWVSTDRFCAAFCKSRASNLAHKSIENQISSSPPSSALYQVLGDPMAWSPW